MVWANEAQEAKRNSRKGSSFLGIDGGLNWSRQAAAKEQVDDRRY